MVPQLTISRNVPWVSDESECGPRTTSHPFWKAERHVPAMPVHAARTPGDLAPSRRRRPAPVEVNVPRLAFVFFDASCFTQLNPRTYLSFFISVLLLHE